MTGIEFAAAKLLISPLFTAAKEYADRRIKAIREDQKANANATIDYLEIASAVMTALENEYNEIFLLASRLARVDDTESKSVNSALVTRIEEYLVGENLRPILFNVSARLKKSRETLEEDAKRFFGRVAPTDDKVAILHELDAQNAYIDEYLAWLGPSEGASAVRLPELKELRSDLLDTLNKTESERADTNRVIAERAWARLNERPVLAIVRSQRIGGLCEMIRAKMAAKN
jgi:hypothetical protein